ncbi:Long chain acyl-CoA synthetase 7, peroxisomal [Mycena indigotica]|uniref:Long chain acyl-CoA synthetase 7, peroxisomal n=1 Tax=Mycena indigotica TaxID=2126181 RepID=A0A8H6SAH6_9AGAR|nr:Long chain acyl-CoA synthetase 7, peroxisomal [Mycena indigotica]KAF7295328.1 Long chain acyl-CoA synthetase 7, peroxisomal [Mycena indigotica]
MAKFLAQDALLPLPAQLPYDKQSVPVAGTKRPGQSAHYVNGMWGLLDPTKYSIKVLPDVFESGLSKGKDRAFLGYRPVVSKEPLKFGPYQWHTYGQVDTRRRHIGSALVHLFKNGTLGGGDLETVGIWSLNRPEWQMVDIALHSYKKVGVTLYDTLGKDSVQYIINHSHLSIVFATIDHVSHLLKLAKETPCLKMIVSLDPLTPETSQVFSEWGQTHNIVVMDIFQLEALGKANLIEPIRPAISDVAFLCYTSGTTSTPKGVVLTHGEFASAVVTNLLGLELSPEGSLISYLPLAHIYERNNEMGCIAIGGKIGFFTGDPLRLIEDCQALQPEFFPGVPRVLNRVYQAAMAAADVPGLKGDLFRKAYAAKIQKFHATGDNTHFFWDKIVFRKLRSVIGGKVRLIGTGSAPISGDVIDFLNVAFSAYVSEGGNLLHVSAYFLLSDCFSSWGMTETGGSGTKTWPGDSTAAGTVGPPQSVCLLKLVDVPAMGYSAEDKPNPRGELCMRGTNVMTTYFKDETNTKAAIDEEGWLHTGDVAEVDHCGRFKIIDRVKNIMKLAQGEYVALEKIENTYSGVPLIQQLYVHGDGLQSFLIGVVVPDPVQLANVVSGIYKKKVTAEATAELKAACGDERVVRHIMTILEAESEKNKLRGFEKIKRIHVSLDPFTIEDGTLTPTFKLRRKDAYNKFKTELDALYALGEPKGKL